MVETAIPDAATSRNGNGAGRWTTETVRGRSGLVLIRKRVATTERATSDQVRDPFEGLAGQLVTPPFDPDALLELMNLSSYHNACIRAKVVDSVGHGWSLLSGDDMDPDEAKDAHDELEGQLDDLCQGYTFQELLDAARLEYDEIGWAAWEVARENEDPDGKIVGLFPVPVATLRAFKRPNNLPGHWVQAVGTQIRHFVEFNSKLLVDRDGGKKIERAEVKENLDRLARELIVFRGYNSETAYYGIPSWIPAGQPIAELRAIRQYNMGFFESSGLASAILHVVAGSEDEAQKILEEIEARMEDARGEAHIYVLTCGSKDSLVDKVELAGSLAGASTDGSFRAQREDDVKEILISHSVPPYRIGWAEIGSLGGSAAKEMLRAYRFGAIEPSQRLIESRLRATLFGNRGIDLSKFHGGVRWKLENLDWDQMETDLLMAEGGARTGAFSPNDVREILGFERKDDPALDKHYVNGIPLGQTGGMFGGPAGAPQGPDPGDEPFDEEDDPEADDSTRQAKFLQKVDRRRRTWSDPTIGGVRSILDAEREAVVAAVRRSKPGAAAERAATRAVEGLRGRWTKWLAETYQAVGKDFILPTLGELARTAKRRKVKRRSAVRKARKPLGDQPWSGSPKKPPSLREAVMRYVGGRKRFEEINDLWRDKVLRYIDDEGAKKVVAITETSREKIREAIKAGSESGDSVDVIAKEIDSLYLDEIIPHRSEVIARTEVIAASNLGQVQVAQAAVDVVGGTLRKVWIATKDARTRDPHLRANGQEVDADAPFLVDAVGGGGQEQMMFPGDSSLGASPANTIQCRCTVAHRLVDE